MYEEFMAMGITLLMEAAVMLVTWKLESRKRRKGCKC
jgi:hypothetical protein